MHFTVCTRTRVQRRHGNGLGGAWRGGWGRGPGKWEGPGDVGVSICVLLATFLFLNLSFIFENSFFFLDKHHTPTHTQKLNKKIL